MSNWIKKFKTKIDVIYKKLALNIKMHIGLKFRKIYNISDSDYKKAGKSVGALRWWGFGGGGGACRDELRAQGR